MKAAEGRVPRKRLVVLDGQQFGYLTDSFQYCRFLRQEYDVTYVGWDYGYEQIPLPDVRVINVSRSGGMMTRLIRLYRTQIKFLRQEVPDVVIVVYHPLCSVVRLLGRARRFVLDIRSGEVRGGPFRRFLGNLLLRIESMTWPHIIILSESLRKKLLLSPRKAHLLPLGAEVPSLPDKDFDSMRLFYVGTFDGRHIDRTIKGVDRFYREFRDRMEISYDIVGFGSKESVRCVEEAICSTGCPERIMYHGRIPYPQLTPFLKRNNIGVVFIPKYGHYEVQPPTKLFEYALSGMSVIATSTLENSRVVTPENGVLTDDTVDGFYEGLKRMVGMLSAYNSGVIKQTLAQYSWENIVLGNLSPYLRRILHVANNVQPETTQLVSQRMFE